MKDALERPQKVDWWLGWAEDLHRGEGDFLRREIAGSFNAAHTDVFLDFSLRSGIDRALPVALEEGSAPDILFITGQKGFNSPLEPAGDFARKGYLLPLNEFSEKYRWDRDRFMSWAMQIGRFNGDLLFIPAGFSTLILFYNKTVFEKHGWNPPTTREELESLCTTITKAGLIPFAHASYLHKNVSDWMISVFLNHCAGVECVRQALRQEKQWDDSEFLEAIELLVEYVQRGWFSGSLENYLSIRNIDRWKAFAKGEAAMNIEGAWGFQKASRLFRESGNEYGWVPIPPLSHRASNGTFTLGVGCFLGINQECLCSKDAAKVLDWIFDPMRAARVSLRSWNVPLRYAPENFSNTEADGATRDFYVNASQLIDRSGQIGYATWTFWPPESKRYLSRELEKVLTGELSIMDYCRKHQRLFSKEFAAGKAPRVFI